MRRKEKEPFTPQSKVQGGCSTHFEYHENEYNSEATEQLVQKVKKKLIRSEA